MYTLVALLGAQPPAPFAPGFETGDLITLVVALLGVALLWVIFRKRK